MKKVPKHREISRQLIAEIAQKKYSVTGRLPSESQLVARFKVSRPTVIRALRDLQEEGLVERRAGSGTFLSGRDSKEVSTPKLGLLVPERGQTEIFEVICGELASLARAEGFILLWGVAAPGQSQLPRDGNEAMEMTGQFIEQGVSGVIFAPFERRNVPPTVNTEISQRFYEAGIPLVLLDRDTIGLPGRSRFDLVGIDNFSGGYLMAEHLIKLGCEKIAYVASHGSASTVVRRMAGVREALLAGGREVAPDFFQVGDPNAPSFARLLTAGRRWDAVVCANDLTAAQLIANLAAQKVRVPEDLRVVGFDDARFAPLLGAPLTTMRQPCRDISLTAFRALCERLSDPTLPPRKLLLEATLVVRQSCGAYLIRK